MTDVIRHRLSDLVTTSRARVLSALAILIGLVAVVAPVALAAQSPLVRSPRTPSSPSITIAPECTSSAVSIEVEVVSLTHIRQQLVVQVRLLNLTDEPVIGFEFEIKGSDPLSSSGRAQIAQLLSEGYSPIIEANCERIVEMPAADFSPGDTLRLAAVLFESGRGEGDVELVDEMRRVASAPLPVPQVRAPN